MLLPALCLLAGIMPAKTANHPLQAPMKAVYDRPATVWESEALPIGNGYMGAMIYGGVHREVVQTNEKTLWSGGPGEDPAYDGGHLRTPAENHAVLGQLRTMLQERASDFTRTKAARRDADGRLVTNDYDNSGTDEYTSRLLGLKEHFGCYQMLSNIVISEADYPALDMRSLWTSQDNEKTPGERIASLFDGNAATKWYSEPLSHPFSLPVFITWNYTAAPIITGYDVTSANDAPGRDPKAWNLYASRDGEGYELVDRQRGDFWGRERHRTVHFPLSIAGYRFFKLEITELQEAGCHPQLADFAFTTSEEPCSGYGRWLDIDSARVSVEYRQGGVAFAREYFMSYPDRVMVMRLRADKPFSRTISVETEHSDYALKARDGQIVLTGYPTPVNGDSRVGEAWRQGLRFAQVVCLKSTDGTVVTEGESLRICDAREIVLLVSAATNYQQCMDESFNYFSSTDPLAAAQGYVDAARRKSYDALYQDHLADYQALYGRNQLRIGGQIARPQGTTDELLRQMSEGTASVEACHYLETLYYQFGRYLLISSSRPGTLPANLQGVWCEHIANPWNSDYHTNINIEMNYWPAEPTNLSECHLPMAELARSLVPRGSITARHFHCRQDGGPVRGWVANHEVNIWGNTAPAQYGQYSYYPEGAIWLCQHIWEHYSFTRDLDFLRRYYDTMLQSALFWVDNLWTDERDQTLVVNPSFSPEHGALSLGCTASQGMIYEIFDIMMKASEVLGRQNDSEIREIADARARLSMPKIGLGGQFQEWKDETTMDITGDNHYRHANHLFWLHPGSQIIPGRSPQETQYAEAMKVSLNTRGNGGTGWSRAWKLNFWARLRDGNHALTMLKSAMRLTTPNGDGGVYGNLFDAHPPFQIDGNLGVTAGVAEMLLQSQGGMLELLPALPDDWSEGEFRGMRARGNFDVDVAWSNHRATAVTIYSRSGGQCHIKYPGIADFSINSRNVKRLSPDEIVVPTTVGQRLILTPRAADTRVLQGLEPSPDGAIYNLLGQRLASPRRGVFVTGGRKVLRPRI